MTLEAIIPRFTILEFIPAGRDCVPTVPLEVEDRVFLIACRERLEVESADGDENDVQD